MRMIGIATLFLGVFSLFACAQQSAAPRRQPYNDNADAKAEIAKTIDMARADHKRILLVLGGNW